MPRLLLRTAVSLQSVCQSAGISSHTQAPSRSVPDSFLGNKDNAAVSVDDILRWPVETSCLNEAVMSKLQSNNQFVSSSAQTEGMDLEERIALEIKHRLRVCGSSGAEA
ncbi:hypothetical protein L7F22_040793 [Adiantum nelumboides]|nr:hypothetical protein [Adiantum nelumboides]